MRSDPRPLPTTVWGALFDRWTWRMAWRDSRTQRLRLFIFSLAIVSGVAALVAIQSLKASVQKGIESQAKELLGADLQISSRDKLSDAEAAKVARFATRTSRELAFPTMMTFPDGSAKLVQVRAWDGPYPFYGRIETEPASAWTALPGEQGVILEATLLRQFGLAVGEEVKLGNLRLRILGEISKAPASTARFTAFAPQVFVRYADIDRSGLLGPNSMVTHLLHMELPGSPPASEVKSTIRKEYPDSPWRVQTPEDRQEALGDALELFQRYLGILAFASLALGAIGVAGAVHSHIRRRVSTIAILRCLGAPRQLAAAVYIAQTTALGLMGALAGSVVGMGIQLGVLLAFRESLPIAITPAVEWAVVARTTFAGFAVCFGFALIPLLQIGRISPAITLRTGADGLENSARVVPVYLGLLGLLVLLAFSNDPSWKWALILVGGLAFAFLLVGGVARGFMALARRLVSARWPYLLRQGVSNLYRPANQTLLFLLSLGMGAFLLLTILLVGNLLQQRVRLPDSAETPSLYLVDVQPDQVEGVSALIRAQQLPLLESARMVSMRVQAIRGEPVGKIKDLPRWIARREFRSSYRERLTASETLVAGTWQSTADKVDGRVPVSIEESLVTDMGMKLGDAITLDVQGVAVEARLLSIRKVDWSRFNLNFFMVFPPGVLENAPGFEVITTRAPDAIAAGKLQRSLATDFANVSTIDLTQILGTVREILSKIALVVTLMGGLTLLAALPIVIGTLLDGRDVRIRESVLLRTLGASARQIRTILIVEYLALGLLSALTGILLAVAANAVLAVAVFKASAMPSAGLVLAAFAVTTLISVIGGLALSRGVTGQSPLKVLREG